MHHLAIPTLVLAIFCHSEATFGQANIPSTTRTKDAILEINGSNTSSKTLDDTMSQPVSSEAIAEAKRLYKSGVKYGRSGLFIQAAELFRQAIRLNPSFGDAHYGLGQAYFDQGRWQEAIQAFEDALKINPKDKDARERLDEAHVLARSNPQPTRRSEKETSTESPASPSAWNSRRDSDGAASVPVSLGVSTDSRPNNTSSALTARDDLTSVYHIGVGDVLDVRLGDEPTTQSTLFTVTPSGLLEHPILGEPLQVSGLTVEQTRALIETDLKRRAVNENPKVFVGVREYLSHAIIVSGLVKDPGTKLLRREGIPLYVVIADAQPAPEAGTATLIRHATGETLTVDLAKPGEMNVLVRSGDVITVYENPKQFFYVGGEVKAPGEKQYRPGLTLMQAILAAGGLSRESKKAQVAREGKDGFLLSTRYNLKDINTGKLADPLIQPGDRITVQH